VTDPLAPHLEWASSVDPQVLSRAKLRDIVLKHRIRVLQLVVSTFFAALCEAALLVLVTGLAVNLVSGNSSIGPYLGVSLDTQTAALIGAGCLILRLSLSLTGIFLSNMLSADVRTEQRNRVTKAFLYSNWATQSSEPPGRLQELLTTFIHRITATVQAFTTGVTAALGLAALLLTSLSISVLTTLLAACVLVTFGLLLFPLRKRVRGLAAIWVRADVAFANSVSELGDLGLEMQTFGVRKAFFHEISELTVTSTRIQRRTENWNTSQSQLYISLAYGSILAGVAVGTSMNLGNMAIIGAVLLLMLRSLSYGQTLSSAVASISTYSPFLDQINELTAEYLKHEVQSGEEMPTSPVPVTLKDVSFSYSGRDSTLKDVSFQIEGTDLVGIIGPSGSGKSTIAQLVLGLREPTEGCIHVGGTPLPRVDRSWWCRNTAFVPQEPKLITGTIADNIRFFRDGIEDEDIERVANDVNLLDAINALPRGIDTHIGPKGTELSGGQRQRISIARALVTRPRLIVMDEPTSSLDAASEAVVIESLESLKGQTAILLIAHRMSTIAICDKIVVVEHGRVTAVGDHKSLVSTNPYYKNAVRGI